MRKVALYLMFAVSVVAVAQSPRFSLSTHATSMNTGERIPGAGATFAYNFARRFSVESTLNFFPGDPFNNLGRPGLRPVLGAWHSGNVLQGQFGVKGTLMQTRRVGIFLTVKPGFVSYSKLQYVVPASAGAVLGYQYTDPLRQTYFAPFFGAGTEISPSQRTFFRFDGGATVIRYSGFTTSLNFPTVPGAAPWIISPQAATTHTFQFSTGFGLRLGRPR